MIKEYSIQQATLEQIFNAFSKNTMQPEEIIGNDEGLVIEDIDKE